MHELILNMNDDDDDDELHLPFLIGLGGYMCMCMCGREKGTNIFLDHSLLLLHVTESSLSNSIQGGEDDGATSAQTAREASRKSKICRDEYCSTPLLLCTTEIR